MNYLNRKTNNKPLLTDLEPRFLTLQGMWAGDPTAAITCLGESEVKWGPLGLPCENCL